MPNYDEYICDYCKQPFPMLKRSSWNHKVGQLKHAYCSMACRALSRVTAVEVECAWCHNTLKKIPSQLKRSKSGRHFCNRSCAISFNNQLKRRGRRSKCEEMLFSMLVEEFPSLDIIPNGKEMLNGLEADIAIPSLRLAIEWNGIVHFQPIYGERELSRIQRTDAEKQQRAHDLQIQMIIISDLTSRKSDVIEAFNSIAKLIKELLDGRA